MYILNRWAYDDTVTDASISRDILPVQFPFKACDWTHVVISVQAGQEGDVNGGLVSNLNYRRYIYIERFFAGNNLINILKSISA